MEYRTTRSAHCEPGSITDARQLGQRLRLSRERLAASELANHGMAWRLWAACVDATFGYAREGDTIYLSALARSSGVHRSKAGPLMRRFDELGVFSWEAAPRGSHGISRLALPPHEPPTVHEQAPSCTAHGSLQSTELSVQCHGYVENPQAGAPGQVAQGQALGSQGSTTEGDRAGTHAGTPTVGQPARDLAGMSREQLAALARADATTHDAIKAELARREAEQARRAELLRRFPADAFDYDGRTGDSVGDDERSQLRWRADNASKVRARERRRD